jgi:hypothetical protein
MYSWMSQPRKWWIPSSIFFLKINKKQYTRYIGVCATREYSMPFPHSWAIANVGITAIFYVAFSVGVGLGGAKDLTLPMTGTTTPNYKITTPDGKEEYWWKTPASAQEAMQIAGCLEDESFYLGVFHADAPLQTSSVCHCLSKLVESDFRVLMMQNTSDSEELSGEDNYRNCALSSPRVTRYIFGHGQAGNVVAYLSTWILGGFLFSMASMHDGIHDLYNTHTRDSPAKRITFIIVALTMLTAPIIFHSTLVGLTLPDSANSAVLVSAGVLIMILYSGVFFMFKTIHRSCETLFLWHLVLVAAPLAVATYNVSHQHTDLAYNWVGALMVCVAGTSASLVYTVHKMQGAARMSVWPYCLTTFVLMAALVAMLPPAVEIPLPLWTTDLSGAAVIAIFGAMTVLALYHGKPKFRESATTHSTCIYIAMALEMTTRAIMGICVVRDAIHGVQIMDDPYI